MKKVYVIAGESRECSDYFTWLVGVTDSQQEAIKFCKDINIQLEGCENKSLKYRNKLEDQLKSFDPNIRIGYAGTNYSWEEFKLNEIPKIWLESKLYKTLNGEKNV